jgi:hypothetical protein
MLIFLLVIPLVLIALGFAPFLDIKKIESKPLDYNERWSDKKYVDMMHTTMINEIKAFGEVRSLCECPIHKKKELSVPPNAEQIRVDRLTNTVSFSKEYYNTHQRLMNQRMGPGGAGGDWRVYR